jgi:TnpA family transposase
VDRGPVVDDRRRPESDLRRRGAWLQERQALLPGITTLKRLVGEGRKTADRRLWAQLTGRLPGSSKAALRSLLSPPADDRKQRVTELERLRRGVFRPIANATFRVRRASVWGEGSTAVVSDSTHFRSWDQNIFTEWHSRYGGRGMLIYWSVEKGSVVIHSQRINCSASEVHAMVEGAVRHGTEMKVESNYVDSHGQSEIGFGITKLLGFDQLPRIKRINKCKLYRPAAGESGTWSGLGPALTRPIRWELIAEQYDQMVKYATAIRTGTASTEAILRRFIKANASTSCPTAR